MKTKKGFAGFEDQGRRPQAKECRRPVEAGKGEETFPPQSLQKGIRPCECLDLSPVRYISDV